MTLYNTLGLAVAMFFLAITPGPGVFTTVSKALSSGFRNTVPVILGIVSGDLIFLLFAIYGLATIAEAFHAVFGLIKYLGAIYLIVLGIRLWQTRPDKTDHFSEALPEQAKGYSFLAGLSITLGNPKVILFYLGFLPTFVNLETLSQLDVAIAASVVTLVLGMVMLFYAYTASRARLLVQSETAQNWMNRTAGTVLIGTGTVLLTRH